MVRPPKRVRSWDWICDNIRDKDGTPFDPDAFPHAEGVADAFDDPEIRTIVLQWATRIGKTFICESLDLKTWATAPAPSAFISSSKKLATETVREEFYPMLEHLMADQLKPATRRSMTRIDLAHCGCRVGWATSESTMSGFGAWLLHLNEVDKWPFDESLEGDRLEQAMERSIKQFPEHKNLIESTPTTEEHSRVNNWYKLSNQCQRQVPCPFCGWYQVLRRAEDGLPGQGGLVWDRLPGGEQDPDRAHASARYECESCHKSIHDEHRPKMMKAGRWVPAGQHVDKRGRLLGTPDRQGHIWGSQLSSLYSLRIRWGDYTRKWVASERRPGLRRAFTNLWDGEPHAPRKSKLTPEELAERLNLGYSRGKVPKEASFITCGVDVQEWGYVYMVVAWGTGERGWLIDWGDLDDLGQLEQLIDKKYPVADDKKTELPIVLTFVDSGHDTLSVYRFCKQHSRIGRYVWACTGEKMNLKGEPYRKVILGKPKGGKNKRMRKAAMVARGQVLVHVAVVFWEELIQDYLDKCVPGEAGSFGFPREAADDMELCKQLLNGMASEKLNRRNVNEVIWIKRWVEEANDFRDTLRYVRCAAEVYARGRWTRKTTKAKRKMPFKTPKKSRALEGSPLPVEKSGSHVRRRSHKIRGRR
jgi:phage terminase large subunit GpA-like protein